MCHNDGYSYALAKIASKPMSSVEDFQFFNVVCMAVRLF